VNGWRDACRRGLFSGSLASILSAIVLAVCGVIEGKTTSAGPLNGPSQWLWGRHAAHRRRSSWRYTAVGYAVHHVASVGWAVLHEKHVAGPLKDRPRPVHFLVAAGTAALASFVDYQIARGRAQPGFEKQLTRKSLLFVYAAFALGLALYPQARLQAVRRRMLIRPRAYAINPRD
jgi:hypothetical protein